MNSLQARAIEYQLAPVMSSGRLIGDGGLSTPDDFGDGAVNAHRAVWADNQSHQLTDADITLNVVIADMQRYDITGSGVELNCLSRSSCPRAKRRVVEVDGVEGHFGE